MNYCELLSTRGRGGLRITDLPAGVRDLPLSRIGFDLARNISKQVLWVLFVNTGGSRIAPWRRMIILDTEYRGEGQVGNPSRIGRDRGYVD